MDNEIFAALVSGSLIAAGTLVAAYLGIKTRRSKKEMLLRQSQKSGKKSINLQVGGDLSIENRNDSKTTRR